MIVLYDSCSLGYDYRDFELVLDFIKLNPDNQFLIYTDERNIQVFANSVPSHIRFEGYPQRSFSKQRLQELVEENHIDSDKIFCFSDLYSTVLDSAKLPSGFLKPSGRPYLNPPDELVKSYRMALDNFATHYDNTVIFTIISGLKPLSDIGKTLDEQKLEGYRQTYPFEEIANVLKFIQNSLIQQGVAIIPISAQYGKPNEIEQLVQKVSQDKNLQFPIKTFRDIDWFDKPEKQAAFFRAVHERACDLGLPSVSFGNAATYQHLIIAVTGGFHVSAVALDSYEKAPSKDGRLYWKELGNGSLPGLEVFQQNLNDPGNWQPVTQAIQEYLKDSINSYIYFSK